MPDNWRVGCGMTRAGALVCVATQKKGGGDGGCDLAWGAELSACVSTATLK